MRARCAVTADADHVWVSGETGRSLAACVRKAAEAPREQPIKSLPGDCFNRGVPICSEPPSYLVERPSARPGRYSIKKR